MVINISWHMLILVLKYRVILEKKTTLPGRSNAKRIVMIAIFYNCVKKPEKKKIQVFNGA